jgi:DNA-directed RNA polymerase subunit N (RpoN/RPB10)
MVTRYRCPRCGDEMAAKFQRSHERICAWTEQNEARAVAELLASLGWPP